MNLFVSIIIATHNRSRCISNAIDSALVAFTDCKGAVEIIIVDDFSTDNSESVIRERFIKEIDGNVITYIKLSANRGVSGARNVGVTQARGEWVLFLDSDDTLIPFSGQKILNELLKYQNSPVVFFRCINQNGDRVGTNFDQDSQQIDLKEFLQFGSRGECLVAVKKDLMIQVPFEESLRGYEGLTIARIIRDSNREAILSNIIARKYIQTGDDRLSSKSGLMRRLHLISKGHWMMASEFFTCMPLKTSLSYLTKAIAYKALHYKYKLFG